MNMNPSALSASEWQEVALVPAVMEAWGLEAANPEALGEELQSMAYGAKFEYVSGSPGYTGELFTVYGDSLSEPFTLIRNQTTEGLVIVE